MIEAIAPHQNFSSTLPQGGRSSAVGGAQENHPAIARAITLLETEHSSEVPGSTSPTSPARQIPFRTKFCLVKGDLVAEYSNFCADSPQTLWSNEAPS